MQLEYEARVIIEPAAKGGGKSNASGLDATRGKAVGSRFEQVEGDISVGGMHFVDQLPISGNRIDLRFKLPGRAEEVHVAGEVVQVSKKKDRYGAHVRFGDMDIETQRAIARFIDDRT